MSEKKTANKNAFRHSDKLEDQIFKTLIELGWVIPQTEGEVQLAKEALARTECPPLPASLADPSRLIDLLDEDVSKGVAGRNAYVPSKDLSLSSLLKRLKKIGIDFELLRRLLPRTLRIAIGSFRKDTGEDEKTIVQQVAMAVGRVFGWSIEALLDASVALTLKSNPLAAARLKVPARASKQRLDAYVVYVYEVAMILLKATADLPCKPVPATAEGLRNAIKQEYGSVTFEHALRYVWGLGIPVLPLNHPGAFHGACWRVNGRNVIAIKQSVRSLARWLFDLLHEILHAGKHPEQLDLELIEDDVMSESRRQSPEEREANRLAGDVILDGRAEVLAQRCAQVSRLRIPQLKRTVTEVAAKEGVAVDALANYLAFRLSYEGESWWSTAMALQDTSTDPWLVARNVLLEHIDLSRLNYNDRILLEQALMDESELGVGDAKY